MYIYNAARNKVLNLAQNLRKAKTDTDDTKTPKTQRHSQHNDIDSTDNWNYGYRLATLIRGTY